MGHFFLEETAVLTAAEPRLGALWHGGGNYTSLPPCSGSRGVPGGVLCRLYTWTWTTERRGLSRAKSALEPQKTGVLGDECQEGPTLACTPWGADPVEASLHPWVTIALP